MPVKLNFVKGGIGVEFISEGIVLGREIIEANKQTNTPKNLRLLKYKLIDRTNCTEYRVTQDDIETIAHQAKEAAKINPNLVILLISTTPVQFGMTRMYQARIDETGLRMEQFADRTSADKWMSDNLELGYHQAE